MILQLSSFSFWLDHTCFSDSDIYSKTKKNDWHRKLTEVPIREWTLLEIEWNPLILLQVKDRYLNLLSKDEHVKHPWTTSDIIIVVSGQDVLETQHKDRKLTENLTLSEKHWPLQTKCNGGCCSRFMIELFNSNKSHKHWQSWHEAQGQFEKQ